MASKTSGEPGFELDDLDLGGCDGLDALGIEGPAVEAGQCLSEGFLADGLGPDVRVDDPARNVAATETRDLDFLPPARVDGLERRLELALGGLNTQLHPVLFDGFDCSREVCLRCHQGILVAGCDAPVEGEKCPKTVENRDFRNPVGKTSNWVSKYVLKRSFVSRIRTLA